MFSHQWWLPKVVGYANSYDLLPNGRCVQTPQPLRSREYRFLYPRKVSVEMNHHQQRAELQKKITLWSVFSFSPYSCFHVVVSYGWFSLERTRKKNKIKCEAKWREIRMLKVASKVSQVVSTTSVPSPPIFSASLSLFPPSEEFVSLFSKWTPEHTIVEH